MRIRRGLDRNSRVLGMGMPWMDCSEHAFLLTDLMRFDPSDQGVCIPDRTMRMGMIGYRRERSQLT